MMQNLQSDRKLMIWALLFYLSSGVSCQHCGGTCQCLSVPACAAGVRLILDGCQCCRVCARQRGEACGERFLCDSLHGLRCDYSSSFLEIQDSVSVSVESEIEGMNAADTLLIRQKELGCEFNGVSYQEGQVFQPSCALQCHCLGGGVTCVPQCREDGPSPTPDCRHPRRVQPPGKCCKEWMCENMDNTLSQDSHTASITDQSVPATVGYQTSWSSVCVDYSSEWSACSHTCGAGISTRVSNQNPACVLQLQKRLCTIRPCQHVLHRTPQGSRRKCQPSYRSARPLRFFHQGCYSTRFHRPRFCGVCTDSRCCSPHHTSTVMVPFLCPDGRLSRHAVMTIHSCICHHNCPHSSVDTYRGLSSWG